MTPPSSGAVDYDAGPDAYAELVMNDADGVRRYQIGETLRVPSEFFVRDVENLSSEEEKLRYVEEALEKALKAGHDIWLTYEANQAEDEPRPSRTY